MANVNFLELSDGVKLAYQIDGPANGDWIICSNSLATDMRLFDYEASYLAKTFRVLRYDTRGHGQSTASQPPYSFPQLVGDLIALMDHVGIAKADVLGVSLGGMTALALAVHHPDRVNRIVCCDARADAPDPYKAIWDGNIAKLHNENLAALCEPTLTRWFTESFLADGANKPKLDVVRDMFNATASIGYEGTARCLQSLDVLPSLSGLTHDALFMTGAQDVAAPVAVMQAMADATPNGTFKVIADAAHLSNLEQPQAFKNEICAFLGC
ncbi:alpha/beta fold hydrolase [Yoonia sp. I 8.24]|uniref:alpha/beta fold hydrolase n=1 Tax=Yoonia sp. I 8.24 TaxID=1537229 RepID=UPI001EE0C868|nr:alpha/beta fold hydrolase [Yoonia sp. I 8.24]MCG3268075.1 alpha/beta fold hydrolase [Yoonia sp. I 8.24]